jgi:hypothetical protein
MVFKKPVPPGLKMFRVPQTTGQSGWIIFTYELKKPVCLWISGKEAKKLPCIIDERLCGDTFLKVEKVSSLEYVVSDIWMYNSNCVFACSTFKQRYDWLQKLLSRFTSCVEGVTIDLIHKSDMDNIPLRGYEEHSLDIPGRPGYFIEKDDSEVLTVTRLGFPDCYEIQGKGFLRVPDFKTSAYLRSKGQTFNCKCVKYDEEFWDVAENIPNVE